MRIITIWTQRNVFPFCSLYYIYAGDVKSAHTHIKRFVWGCKVFGLRGEGRREGNVMEKKY